MSCSGTIYLIWKSRPVLCIHDDLCLPFTVGHTGPEQIGDCLSGAEVVVIPAGVPRKPGICCDQINQIC